MTFEQLKETYPQYWFVKLLPEEAEKLRKMGKARNENGKANGWKTKTPDESDKFHVLGIAGEFAVALIFNEPVGTITSRSARFLNEVGDVGGFIEVRTSTKSDPRSWDLGGFEDAVKPERAYVHCLGHLFPEFVVVTGWAWGKEILASEKVRIARHAPDKAIRFLEQDRLRKVSTLFDEVKIKHPWKWGELAR